MRDTHQVAAAVAFITLAGLATGQPASDGATVWRGRLTDAFTSEPYPVAAFDRAVLSWNARGEARFELEAGGRWHPMGKWGPRPEGAKTEWVDVDTLVLKDPATSFRFRVTPSAGSIVTLVAVASWRHDDAGKPSTTKSAAWGRILDVPRRSQRDAQRDPGSVCSPTSVGMVLAFHGTTKTTDEVAAGVYDHGQKIYGNWALNCAFAHAASELEAYVIRPPGFEALEAEIAAGRPVVLSHRWKDGDLDGAPIKSSAGHLIVVAGFTETGDVVVNDPAAPADAVRRIYQRAQLHRTWRERGAGVAYVLRKPAR